MTIWWGILRSEENQHQSMAKTSTSLFPEKKSETNAAQAPEWLIQNLLGFSKSLEAKSGKSGKKILVHKN